MVLLLDVFNRVPLLAIRNIPDADQMEADGLTGTPDLVLQTLLNSIIFLSAAWAIVRLGSIGAEAIIASPRVRPGSVDGNLVRLGMRLLSLAIGLAIMFEGMRSLGVPVMGVIAGLGVGGLTVALAAQSTIENFIGSLEFSRMQLDNLTLRDRILFRTQLNLRLETYSDQLRLVLARLRELLLGHPMIQGTRPACA